MYVFILRLPKILQLLKHKQTDCGLASFMPTNTYRNPLATHSLTGFDRHLLTCIPAWSSTIHTANGGFGDVKPNSAGLRGPYLGCETCCFQYHLLVSSADEFKAPTRCTRLVLLTYVRQTFSWGRTIYWMWRQAEQLYRSRTTRLF